MPQRRTSRSLAVPERAPGTVETSADVTSAGLRAGSAATVPGGGYDPLPVSPRPPFQASAGRGNLPSSMEKAHPQPNRQCLLLVDDQPFFTAFLREKFEEQGYSVATAGDGREALAFVQWAGAPLVVLLDLMLPRLSGQQLLRELTRGAGASGIRVVLVSAHHTVATIAPNHPMVVGRAQKPVDLGELTRMVGVAARDLASQASGFRGEA
jgi:CheY-like chemotaxis protein